MICNVSVPCIKYSRCKVTQDGNAVDFCNKKRCGFWCRFILDFPMKILVQMVVYVFTICCVGFCCGSATFLWQNLHHCELIADFDFTLWNQWGKSTAFLQHKLTCCRCNIHTAGQFTHWLCVFFFVQWVDTLTPPASDNHILTALHPPTVLLLSQIITHCYLYSSPASTPEPQPKHLLHLPGRRAPLELPLHTAAGPERNTPTNGNKLFSS